MKTTLKTSARVADPASKAAKAQDFSNHHLSVGIDVHKKRWQVAVLCDGICLGNISIEADADLLIRHLRGKSVLRNSLQRPLFLPTDIDLQQPYVG